MLYVNSAKYKIFKNHKKYLEVLQFLKPKEKILIDIKPFFFFVNIFVRGGRQSEVMKPYTAL